MIWPVSLISAQIKNKEKTKSGWCLYGYLEKLLSVTPSDRTA